MENYGLEGSFYGMGLFVLLGAFVSLGYIPKKETKEEEEGEEVMEEKKEREEKKEEEGGGEGQDGKKNEPMQVCLQLWHHERSRKVFFLLTHQSLSRAERRDKLAINWQIFWGASQEL